MSRSIIVIASGGYEDVEDPSGDPCHHRERLRVGNREQHSGHRIDQTGPRHDSDDPGVEREEQDDTRAPLHCIVELLQVFGRACVEQQADHDKPEIEVVQVERNKAFPEEHAQNHYDAG
jgi:hypothetical protein